MTPGRAPPEGSPPEGITTGEARRRRDFLRRLHRWFVTEGRHDLPWQRDRRAYAVWVSEIMLQQTTVDTVRRYYTPFMRRFPTVRSLARAELDEVLRVWSGLGYYRRAHHLHAAARLVVERHGGRLPRTPEGLLELPGIGRSTAGAVLSLAYDRPAVVLDTNVRRVLERYWSEALRRRGNAERALWELAAWLLPSSGGRVHTQGLMDLGALVCRPRSPLCTRCPLVKSCPGPREAVPRLRSARGTRRLVLLYRRDRHGRIFLVRRPAHGIWAGFWCLPERGEGPPGETRSLLTRRHTLSHLELEIRIVTEPPGSGRLPITGVWTTEPMRERLAIPPVVREMLESLPPRVPGKT